MRSYAQLCAVALGLDVIGDRWTLLIVRELLIRGSARYTDLRLGLPGIASNLLVDRLRELQREGLVVSASAPPPVAAALFSLTDRGRELEPVLAAIGHWGAPLLRENAGEFQSHWLALPLRLELTDRWPDQAPIALQIDTGDEPLVLRTGEGGISATPGRAENPDAVISGPPALVMALLLGDRPLAELRRAGLAYEGSHSILARLRPVRGVAAEAVPAHSG